jgi:hypothetical protein
MAINFNKIEIGDLVKVRTSFLHKNQDILYLPYDEHSVGLVVNVEDSGFLFDSDLDISASFQYYITVKWMGADVAVCRSDEYVHLPKELFIISKVGEELC